MDRTERLKRQKDFLVQVAYWAVWGTVAIVLIKYVGPAVLPFVIAFFVAWALSHPTDFLSERLHLKRSLAAVLVVALFYLLIGGLVYLLGSRIVTLIQDMFSDISAFLTGTLYPMIEKFSAWYERTVGTAQTVTAGVDGGTDSMEFMGQASEILSGMSAKLIDKVSGVASYIPQMCMNILLTVIATVFTELEFKDILKFMGRLIPKRWQQTATEIKSYTVGTLGKCVLSYVIIFGVTFVELTVGFWILGVDGALPIAFLIAILDILPVLGTGTVLLPWMVIAFASGNLKMGLGILVLYLVITVVRNILEPRLVGRQMGLSPVVMLPCMILGLRFFGIIGLFVVPFAVAFIKDLNDRGVLHLFRAKE